MSKHAGQHSLLYHLTAFLLMASLWPQPGIAESKPASGGGFSLEVEIGDAFHPYLTQAEQANLWPEVWRNSKVTVYYNPTRLIEGKTQKTTRHFQIFGGLIGVGPVLDPGIKKKVVVFSKQIELPLKAVSSNGQTTLHCDIPEQTDPLYDIAGFEILASTKPFAELAKFREIGPQTEETISFQLFKAALPAFRVKKNVIPLPSDYERGGAITVRARLKHQQSGEEMALEPTNVSEAEGNAREISDSIKGTLLPNEVPSGTTKGDYLVRIAVMPKKAPRWYGLFAPSTAGGSPEPGTRIELRKKGTFSTLTLTALGGNDRVVDGIIPIKQETWYFLDGKLMRNKGLIRYFPAEYCANGLCDKLGFHEIANRAGNIPPTSWRTDFIEARRVNALLNEKPVANDKEKIMNPDCGKDGCRLNDAEALAQIRKSHAILEAEGKSYLDLFAAKP